MNFRSLLTAALATASLAGPVWAESQPIQIRFSLQSGSTPVTCTSPPVALGTQQTLSALKDARFYLHSVQLLKADGASVPVQLDQNDWQYLNVALVDLENAQGSCAGNKGEHATVTGMAPAGHYTGVQFTVGVPVSAQTSDDRTLSLNHSHTEQAPAPLDIQAMAWNWQAGRKFMKIEVAPEGGVKRTNDTVKIWTVHLGSTGCTGNPANGEITQCSSPNHVPVRLDNFNPQQDQVVLDLAQLFLKADMSHDQGGAAGCMSSPQDPECTAIFSQLGLRLTPSAPDSKDAGRPLPGFATPVFRKERRAP